MVCLLLVDGTGHNGHQPFLQALPPIFGAGGVDSGGQLPDSVRLPVPGRQIFKIRPEWIVFGTEIGMDHRTQVRHTTKHIRFLQGTPDRVFPIIGDRLISIVFRQAPILHYTPDDIAAKLETSVQKLLYLNDKTIPTMRTKRRFPRTMLLRMHISAIHSLQTLFGRQVGKGFTGILHNFFFGHSQTVAVGGKEMDVIVAVALGISILSGCLLTGRRNQLHDIFSDNGFYRRQIAGPSALSSQPGFETGGKIKLRIVRNNAETTGIASRSIGFSTQQALIPVFHPLVDSRMTLRHQFKPDHRVDNDFDAMPARTDPAGHRIDSLTHQSEQVG